VVAVTVVVVVAGEVVTEDEIEEGVAGEVVYDVLLRGWREGKGGGRRAAAKTNGSSTKSRDPAGRSRVAAIGATVRAGRCILSGFVFGNCDQTHFRAPIMFVVCARHEKASYRVGCLTDKAAAFRSGRDHTHAAAPAVAGPKTNVAAHLAVR